MGDKSPQKQIKIGNITVKLNPNNQQRNKRDSNYEKHFHRNDDRNSGSNERHNDRHNERYSERYNDRYNDRDRDRERDRDKGKDRYQKDSKDYNKNNEYKDNNNNRYLNKKSDYDSRKDKYSKNYKNKSNSHSKSRSGHRHSHTKGYHSRSRSISRSYSHHHDKQNKNNQSNNNNPQNNNNNLNNNSFNNNTVNNTNNNNYNEFFKKFYQMNGLKNTNVNNIIVPIGIPVNYFYNPNLNNMNQINQMNKINSQNNQNTQLNNQNNNKNQNQKEEPSNTILITDLDTNITKETLEDIFRDKCLKLQISMPIDIRLVEALNIAYVIFPSVTSCVIVYNSLLNQKILINGKYFPVQFSPNLTQKYSNNRDTLTYVTQISSNTSLTTSMETTVHEDWYCVYCDSKNFSRRTVCFKCQKPKSINCRVVPVIKQKKIILGANGEILPNNSIIIQGKQIQYSNEGEVFIFY